MKDEKLSFKREMRPIDVWGLALGAIIGWGCFVLPGTTFLPKAGPLGTTIGMLIGAVVVIIISLSYAFLIRRYPVSGGEFVYAGTAFGKTHAFICGWALIIAYWSLIPLNATAVALISRYLFPGIVQVGKLYEVAGWDVYAGEIVVATAFLIIMGIINIIGIKSASWIQTAIALTLVGTVLIIFAGVMGGGYDWDNLKPGFQNEKNWFGNVFAIVAMAPWAYLGFDCIPQAAEEYKFEHKKSLWIMILAILCAATMYIMVNTLTAIVKPWQEMLAAKEFWPTGMAVHDAMGVIGLVILGVAMFCAVVSGINAFYISTSRLMHSMAQMHALPKFFGKLHPKHRTPKNAIIFIMIISLIAPWFGREVLNWIVDMTSVCAALAFAYTTSAAAKIAYRHGQKAQMVTGIVGCVLALFFLSLLVIPGMPGFLSLQSRIVLGIWVGMGVVFYIIMRKKYNASPEFDGGSELP